jgi:N-acetylglutamate synthase-like GNAT family acetyltransferase
MMPRMPVRHARATDVDTLVDLINRAYEVEAFFVSGDRTDAAEIRQLLAAGEFFLLDDDAGAALGCVYVAPRPDARAYLGLLSVEPDGQQRGTGRQLVGIAEAHARGLGARVMELVVVDVRSELRAWYARQGYEVVGEMDVPREKVDRFTRPVKFLRMEKTL